MGFLNVYNNFKDFNAHLSHAFKVTFFDNILTNDENAASFSVKSVTKPVFKLSTEEYTRELGNSRFVIPIIDFSSAHMSITFYESDNMAVQAYLSSIYGSIGSTLPPIKILLEEFDNSMCIRLSSKVYLARLIELSLPGFNNDGPGSIQEITAEFNVMRVYDNLPDLTAPVDLKYGYKKDYKFEYNDTEINVETSSLKPSEIQIDNLTFTQDKWKKLQITKRKLVSDYETKMSELNEIIDEIESFGELAESLENKIIASNLSTVEKNKVVEMLSNIHEKDGRYWTYYHIDENNTQTEQFEDLDALVNYITKKEEIELKIMKGFGLSDITEDEIYNLAEFAIVKNEQQDLQNELKNIKERLIGMQGTIEELKEDLEVKDFVAKNPEFKDTPLEFEPILDEQEGGQGNGSAPAPEGGQGNGSAPAPAGGGNGGVPPGTPPELVNTGYHYVKANGTMGSEIKFDPPKNGNLHIRNTSIKETVIGTSTTIKHKDMSKEAKINHEKKVIEAFSPIVLKIAKEKNIDERMLPGMFAQMMLESGWLTSYDSTKDVNNFFGLTGAASGTKSYIVSRTHEAAYELRDKPNPKDRQVAVIRAFSQYDNAEDAIRDWLDRTVLSKRYQKGRDGRSGGFQTGGWDPNDVHSYVKVMKNNGYATGDNYIKLVNDIIDKHSTIKNLKYEI